MKQVFQDLRAGETLLVDVPVPTPPPGHLLIRTQASLISAGTERMLVEFGRSSYLLKARQQPEKVKEVLVKARTEGILPTVDSVRNRLNEPVPMGYANAGTVVDVGADVSAFAPGDRVASNGAHAEWVVVPSTLAARIPATGDELPPEQAAFATVGAIALQSVRLAQPTLGERFAVTGLGLVGLLTVQLLRASGCKVLGLDFDPDRLALAESFGARAVDLNDADPIAAARAFSNGVGIDGAIIAAATDSNEPIQQAATMARKRGRIILVGVAGLELQREDFYEKELSFQVSCSYGPGRHDPDHEDRAQDYPPGLVRWTAARNQQAVLELLATGDLDVAPLISHRFAVDKAAEAYEMLLGDTPSLGIVLEYDDAAEPGSHPQLVARRPVASPQATRSTGLVRIGLIGAGNFARRTLLPTLADADVELVAVASRTGTSAALAAREFGIGRVTTRTEDLLQAGDVDAVFIATRHDSHAELTQQALRAGKHVFVEKPLAIDQGEVEAIETVLAELGADAPLLMVGFNRRFAPQIRAIAGQLRDQEPIAVQMTVNAGPVPADSWVHDPLVGGGRIIGEACHFIDLARFLVGHPITGVESSHVGRLDPRDSSVIMLEFDDGSVASISYLANGHPKVPKERIEVFHRGRVAQLDNFRRLKSHGFATPGPRRVARQDKGHAKGITQFLTAIRNGLQSPIPPGELLEVATATIRAAG